MPVMRLGAVLTSPGPYYPGVTVTTDECMASQCGVPLSDAQKYVCSVNGYAGVRAGCSDPQCVPYRSQLNCAAAAAASPVPVVSSPATPTVQQPATQQQQKTVTVETPAGPVQVPAVVVPGVSDVTLVPTTIRIPNIWDSLDPTKVSQFEFRGRSMTLPVWISAAYRRSLVPTGAAAPGAPTAVAPFSFDIPGWVWLALLALLWLANRKRRHAPRHRKVAHGH